MNPRNINTGKLMKFEVPRSYLDKHFVSTGMTKGKKLGIFPQGLPKGFLTKVSKYEDVIDKSRQGPISKEDFRKMYREGKIKFPK